MDAEWEVRRRSMRAVSEEQVLLAAALPVARSDGDHFARFVTPPMEVAAKLGTATGGGSGGGGAGHSGRSCGRSRRHRNILKLFAMHGHHRTATRRRRVRGQGQRRESAVAAQERKLIQVVDEAPRGQSQAQPRRLWHDDMSQSPARRLQGQVPLCAPLRRMRRFARLRLLQVRGVGVRRSSSR